jgi:hypothetical protein
MARESLEAHERFQAADQRFQAADERIQRLIDDMARGSRAADERFRAADQRFQQLVNEMTRGFQAADRRFDAIITELRTQQLQLSALSGRLGYGLEHLVRGVVEEFSGERFTRAERLVLQDTTGEVYGVPADVEFDLLASNGEVYLCEVKSHVKPEDVLRFHKKSTFAARHIERPFVRLIIAASMEARAEALMTSLGIRYIVRARIEPEGPGERAPGSGR